MGSIVGILAISGRYATASQVALKVLEIFSSTFFGLYEPTSDKLKPNPFFPNTHQGPCKVDKERALTPSLRMAFFS
jgi:hypothetical protein